MMNKKKEETTMMKLNTLTLALALLVGTTAQAAVHQTPQPVAPAVVGKAHATHATHAVGKKHNKAKKQAKSNKKKGAKKHGKTSAHKSTPHVH